MKSNFTELAIRDDSDKPSMSLLDRHALVQITRALDFGSKKYDAHNWRKGMRYTRLMDASLRHLFAFNDGEDLDQESGISHIAHAACSLMFLLWMQENRRDMDDRHHTKKAVQQVAMELSEAMAKAITTEGNDDASTHQ